MDELVRIQVPGYLLLGAVIAIAALFGLLGWILKQFMSGELVTKAQLEKAEHETEIWRDVAIESSGAAQKGVEVARNLLPMGHAANNVLGNLQSIAMEQEARNAPSPPQGG